MSQKNIEIKASLEDAQFESINQLAGSMANQSFLIRQTDTYFQSKRGRLKLREFADGTGEIIGYFRTDSAAPKASNYTRANCDPVPTKEALQRTLGIAAVVNKIRQVHLIGPTRVHLDTVETLGKFLELEVVLADGQDEADGTEIAYQLLKNFAVEEDQLIRGSYLDQVLSKRST
ncbi:MAG: class IV adenylate cyclase [Planctomycetota bacterium]